MDTPEQTDHLPPVKIVNLSQGKLPSCKDDIYLVKRFNEGLVLPAFESQLFSVPCKLCPYMFFSNLCLIIFKSHFS